jgi:hypothetical protein
VLAVLCYFVMPIIIGAIGIVAKGLENICKQHKESVE